MAKDSLPLNLLELTDDVTDTYDFLSNELITNIANHFSPEKVFTPTNKWKLKKLAEIGQLKQETIDIIKANTTYNGPMVEHAIKEAAEIALNECEPSLKKAVMNGFLNNSKLPPSASNSVKKIIKTFSDQALSKTNLVNQTMLQSTIQAYKKTINDTVKIEKLNKILDVQAGNQMLGIKTRNEAVKTAVKQMFDEGIYGFVDKAGKKWSPEGYVNMVMRSTVGNVTTKTVFDRNKDYGNNLVSVRIKQISRPLCFPYQGKVISMTDESGQVDDLDGNVINYIPISSTSYGDAAGIWGINCGHVPPLIFIPGISKIRSEPPSEKENDRNYENSQLQRGSEREIRKLRRDKELYDEFGDTKRAKIVDKQIKEKTKELKAFCNETGRTYRADRTQIVKNTPVEKYKKFDKKSSITNLNDDFAKKFKDETIPSEFVTNTFDFDEKLQKDHRAFIEKLRADDFDGFRAIRTYTGGDYREINGFLRGTMTLEELNDGLIDYEKTSKKIKEVMKKKVIDKDIVTYRGIEELPKNCGIPDDFLKIINDSSINWSSPEGKELFSTLKGATITDKGFMSTTISPEIKQYKGKSFLFDIKVPKGTRGIYVEAASQYGNELELLIDSNTEIVIDSVTVLSDFKVKFNATILKQGD